MTEIKKKSILIVDDDTMVIAALKDIISPDYDVYAVKSGEDAIEKAKKITPDLILLDVFLPHMDGHETIKKLRSPKITKNIPVIFISGCTEDYEIEKGIESGALDFITKPFTNDSVLSKIKNAFNNF